MRTKPLLTLLLLPCLAVAEGRTYPPSPSVVDVTKPPYGAKGDGRTDDTDALQLAINENVGRHRLLFIPAGTYLVSRTLAWPKRWKNRENWGFTFIRGEDRQRTVVRLKDGSFTDPAGSAPIMDCGGFGSADWFHNYVESLTFDAGSGNPGATALRFYSNNSGAVRDCDFLAPEGSGATGLDLARDMNGPLLVADCRVVGFRRGIAMAHGVNGQVLENVSLRNQREAGVVNEGQAVSIRALTSENGVPAITTYGTLTLLDSKLAGNGKAASAPAIVNFNGGRIFLRGVETTGYGRALADIGTPDYSAAFRVEGEDRPGSLGPAVPEYCSHAATSPFDSSAGSLRLPVREPPEIPWEDPARWANADDFGADPAGERDSSDAVQRAADSGATILFLPGSYNLRSTVTIRGAIRRIVGLGGMINNGKGPAPVPCIRLADGSHPAVVIEHFGKIGGGLELATRRTLVMSSVQDCDLVATAAASGSQVFMEDVVTHSLRVRSQSLWARQLNIENEGTHLANDGGEVWVLGYKTERGGTLLETRGGGRSELLGGFSYTTTAGGLAPMILNDNSSVFAFFSEVCFNGDPFAQLVKETRGTETRIVKRGEGSTAPYAGVPKRH